MAKVRVYELARDLNLDSKQLVEKLKDGGMSIKNYMSTLDEEAATKARDIVAGRVSEIIEEKRVKPTVIRRRKKTVKIEPEKPALEPEEEAKKVEIELEKRPPVKMTKAAESVAQKVEEEIKKEEVRAKKRPVLKKKKEAPAKEVKKEVPAEVKTVKPVAKEKPKKKVKKAKKRVADKPAKIIKRPEEGPLRELIGKERRKALRPEAPTPKPPAFEELTVAPEGEKKGKPARKKRDKKRVEKNEIAPKGVIRHRKIEVFERADLYEGRMPVRKERKGVKAKDTAKKLEQTKITVPKAIKRRIKVLEQVTVGELARAMGVKAVEVIKRLMSLGAPASINQSIDFETASVVADEFGYELELDLFDVESIIAEIEDKPEDLKPRPPVVTIMGHVDHGKTSLLDYIRQSNIIGGESGGITQHIGAYYVNTKGGDIVFLDTPGHEAFTAMRARGAKVTDIIVLVVAADDGVMPQTVEAVNHARAANIPIIVAINKIDKPEANIEKVTRELAELELVPEAWGGDTIFGNISAKTGEGVEELLELILLQSEVLELKENPDKPARGTIIEAKLDKSRGPIATVLIKRGTLKQGDYFVCGEYYGKLRAMLNHRSRRVESAGPSFPVEIYGISGVPMAGDEFIVVPEEKTAKQVIEHRQAKMKEADTSRRGIVSLDDLFERIREGEIKELNIILKADVQGSIEALSDSLFKLSTEEVKVKIIHSSTGAITETDVMLASASGAIIIGFNVRANPRVTEIAAKEEVDIRYYDVIYNVIKDIQLAMVGLLEPVYKENIIGRADIKQIFHIPKVGTVAGCYVTDGHIERNANVRLLRDDVVIFDGKIASLKRFKDDVKEVQSGYECGVGLENFQDLKPGDVFELYNVEEVEPEL
ncbi:MAG: translation initiation factor IF-2 [Deltaproteobacteria bacterium]|nr:MAG: translation initiation factor IF-2 [Deltaproteobacteria bacterium]